MNMPGVHWGGGRAREGGKGGLGTGGARLLRLSECLVPPGASNEAMRGGKWGVKWAGEPSGSPREPSGAFGGEWSR